jgi:beta-lactamase regulating signal transducer with metallopeptidase domain
MSVPNFTFWWHLLATLAAEVCGLAALGFGAQRFFRSAVWQRAVWQMTVICLLLLPASEWTGFGRGAAEFLFGQKQTVENAPAHLPAYQAAPVNWPLAARSNSPPVAPQPAVWWPGWIWLAGAVVVLGRMAAVQVLLLTLRLRREKILSHALREQVDSVAICVGLRRKVNLLRMPESISPMAFGLLRPSIGLPPGFEARYTPPERDAVLAHELAHLAAGDPMWFLLADLATALLWWQPLAWWVRRSLHLSAELAADEATALVPDGPGALAKCLVNLGKELASTRGWGWIGIKGGFRSKLGMRVERLMRMSSDGKRPLAGWIGGIARIAATLVILPSILLLFGALQSARGQKEDSWPREIRASWNNSPGGLLLLAALNDKEKPMVDAASRVQQAKALYEQGKFNEADAILVRVIKEEPSNRAARYYMDLIKEAQSTAHAMPIPFIAAPPLAPLPPDSTPQPMPIPLTWAEQPMLIPLTSTASLIYVQAPQMLPTFSSNFGVPIAPQLPSPLFDTLPLLASFDGLKLGLGGTDPVEPQEAAPLQAPLYSKMFKVDKTALEQNLHDFYHLKLSHRATLDSADFLEMLKTYFRAAGVNLSDSGDGKSIHIHIDHRAGLLYVRATEQDLEIIQKAIETLNQTPPQVTIEAKFFELSQEEIRKLGPNFYLGNSVTNNGAAGLPAGQPIPPQRPAPYNNPSGIFPGPGRLAAAGVAPATYTPGPAAVVPAPATNASTLATTNDLTTGLRQTFGKSGIVPSVATVSGILSDRQFRLLMNVIEQRTGEDVLSAPKVTTLSGRTAQVSSLDKGEGATLDVIATVEPDGFAIQTTAFGSVKKGNQTVAIGASQTLWDGQTLVLSELMTNQTPGARKLLIVFVTPTIIDPAGNRVHQDDEVYQHAGTPEP